MKLVILLRPTFRLLPCGKVCLSVVKSVECQNFLRYNFRKVITKISMTILRILFVEKDSCSYYIMYEILRMFQLFINISSSWQQNSSANVVMMLSTDDPVETHAFPLYNPRKVKTFRRLSVGSFPLLMNISAKSKQNSITFSGLHQGPIGC